MRLTGTKTRFLFSSVGESAVAESNISSMDDIQNLFKDTITEFMNGAPWLPKRFSDKGVQEGQRKLMGTLWNTYAFYVLYANIDAFDATKYALEYDKLSVMDKWILSKMNSMVKSVDENLAAYAIP